MHAYDVDQNENNLVTMHMPSPVSEPQIARQERQSRVKCMARRRDLQ